VVEQQADELRIAQQAHQAAHAAGQRQAAQVMLAAWSSSAWASS
jgi:hypothetical protein